MRAPVLPLLAAALVGCGGSSTPASATAADAPATPSPWTYARVTEVMQSGEPAEREAMVDGVLADADHVHPLVLLFGSLASLSLERLEDAGLLMLAARLRVVYLLTRFEPEGRGSDHPLVLFDALFTTSRPAVTTPLLADRQAVIGVLGRWRAYPAAPPLPIDPEFAVTETHPESEWRPPVERAYAGVLELLETQAALLADDEFARCQSRIAELTMNDPSPEEVAVLRALPSHLARQERVQARLREFRDAFPARPDPAADLDPCRALGDAPERDAELTDAPASP